MMSFAPDTPRQRRTEPTVPMINVVFLLLVFFLMTAAITPPDALDVSPPVAEMDPADLPADTLFIAADGALAYEDARGATVFPALSLREDEASLAIRADAGLDARDLARILPRLAEVGITSIRIVTVAP